MQYKLFTTSSCHLCEQAIAILNSSEQTKYFTLVDIADCDTLTNLYGHRIPVLQRMDNLEELDWPFTLNDINGFIKSNN
ncbi:MAG: glutaredoxin family protein [Methylophilaceae bacterium]